MNISRILFDYFFKIIDMLIPKSSHIWVFPVYFIGDGDFCDNMLAVYESTIKYDDIKKIILTRNKEIFIQEPNTITIPMRSLIAIYYLLRSNVIFVQHSIWLDLSQSLFQIKAPLKRKIINLWHGIPIKDLSHGNTGIVTKRSLCEFKNYHIICSSHTDQANMQNTFHSTPKDNFMITGLPRNDFLLKDESSLPEQYITELKKLRLLLNNKQLILYAPTYREQSKGSFYYRFTSNDLQKLKTYCEKNNCLLGIRYHIYRRPEYLQELLKNDFIIDLSANIISEIRIILRETTLVITDYSSIYVDALYIGVKCICFAYDYEHYLKHQRGFFYNFDDIFAGEIFKEFKELILHLFTFGIHFPEDHLKIKKIKNILFEFTDTGNSKRAVEQVIKIASS